MATMAAAAVAESQLYSLRKLAFSDPTIKIASSRMLQVASISHSFGIESFLIGPYLTNKWPQRTAAAVFQEEAAVLSPEEAMASEQHEIVIQEEKRREVVSNEVEAAQSSSINTKICIKNLPYKVDNAQLTGIILDYASPELIEAYLI